MQLGIYFQNQILKHFLDSKVREIRIFSRDEKKQEDMRNEYANSKIKFFLGDVRDEKSIDNAVEGSDFIFHAAALKQV
ncbi:UDP-glucose 4-epimerase, partial [archaeon]|nr:UDP-glucose 4-epimerase [archaeon]